MRIHWHRRECTLWHILVFLAIPTYVLINGEATVACGTLNTILSGVFLEMPLTALNFALILTQGVPFMLIWLVAPTFRRHLEFSIHVGCMAPILTAASLASTSCIDEGWQLFLSFSLINVIAIAVQQTVVLSLVSDYFPVGHWCHMLGITLVPCANAIGAMVYNPLITHLNGIYGWRDTFRAMAGIVMLGGVPASLLLRGYAASDTPTSSEEYDKLASDEITKAGAEPLKKQILTGSFLNNESSLAKNDTFVSEETSNLVDVPQKKNIRAILKLWTKARLITRVIIVLWLGTYFVNSFMLFAMKLNIVTYMKVNLGFTMQQAANTMIGHGLGTLVSTIVAAAFGGLIKDYMLAVLAAVNLVSFTISMVFSFADLTGSYGLTAVMVALYGACHGFAHCFMYASTVALAGPDTLVAITITHIPYGVGIFCSPLLGGLMLEVFGVPQAFFYAQAVGWGALTVSTIAISILLSKLKNGKVDEYEKLSGQ